MLKVILTSAILYISIPCCAQTSFKQNTFYLEAGGNGLFGSVNYERQLTKEPGFGARIGIGFYSEGAFWVTIPAGINYLFPLKHASFIDAGLGVTWTGHDEKSSKGLYFFNFVPSIGYRKSAPHDVMWRISLTPVANKYGFVPWVGASVGKRF